MATTFKVSFDGIAVSARGEGRENGRDRPGNLLCAVTSARSAVPRPHVWRIGLITELGVRRGVSYGSATRSWNVRASGLDADPTRRWQRVCSS